MMLKISKMLVHVMLLKMSRARIIALRVWMPILLSQWKAILVKKLLGPSSSSSMAAGGWTKGNLSVRPDGT